MKGTGIGSCGLRYRKYLFYLIVIGVMLFCCITAAARDADTEYGGITASAKINEKNTEEIQITLTPDETFLNAKKGETLYLFILAPHENADNLRMSSPAATKTVGQSTVFTVTADAAGERYRAKYILALGEGADYRVIAQTYVENPDALAVNTAARTKTSSIKGIVASQALMADIQTLGISHAVIPVVIDDYLTANASDPAFTASTGGTSTHFDTTKIKQLDAQVSALRDTGVHILFRFILDGSDRATTEPTAALYASASAEGVSGYGITQESKLAYQTANNIFTYFAERYASEGEPIDFIIGYQVNEWENWYNLGYTAEDAAGQAAVYAAVFRLADTALRSVCANSRVYVPLSNLFASAKPFLTAFAAEMGGSTWSVAVAPYASDPMDDSIWEDADAKDNGNTVYLTMKNLEILEDYLSDETFLYNGKLRAVIIDDFAVHGTSGDTASQERQAASMVYAYYKASMLDFIDAFIWHRIIDGSGEHCSLGLRQLDSTEKPIYQLFRVIDTQLGADAASEYAKIIGEKKWSSVIDGFSVKYAAGNTCYMGTGTVPTEFPSDEETVVLYDFTDSSLHGFLPTEHTARTQVITTAAAGTEIHAQLLQAETYPTAETEYAGLTKLFAKGELPRNTERLYVTLKAELPAGSSGADTVSVRLLLGTLGDGKNASRIYYDGEAEIPVGSFTTVSFDIKDFAKKAGADGADYMKLLIGGLTGNVTVTSEGDDADGASSVRQAGGIVYLNDIRLEIGSGISILNVLAGIAVVILIPVLLFLLLVIRAQIIRRKKRRMRAAQRAAQMRRQQQQRQMQMQGRVQQPSDLQRKTYTDTQYTGNGYTQNPRNINAPHTAHGTEESSRPRRTAQRRPDMYRNNNRHM